MQTWVIANPIAGGKIGKQRLAKAIGILKKRLRVAELRWTGQRGDAERWAREAADRGVGLVIGAGGDGTLNEIANGLAGSDVVLGIVPVGTANVVAYELGIPFDPVRATESLLGGKIERLHVGVAEYEPLKDGDGAPQQAAQGRSRRCFLFAAGIGFDALICHKVNLELKSWTRKAAYVIDGLRLLAAYRSPRLNVRTDGEDRIECSELIVCKARAYGGRFWIAPEASMRKARLDVCMFLRGGRFNLLRYAWGVFRGKHPAYGDVVLRQAESVEVSAEGCAYLHLDGDALGTPPVKFGVMREALSVVTPAAS